MPINNTFKVSMVPTGSAQHHDCHLCGNTIPPHVKLRELVRHNGDKNKDEVFALCPNCDYIMSDTYLALMARRFAIIRTSSSNYWAKYCARKPMEWQ
jgi:hypothetical protein